MGCWWTRCESVGAAVKRFARTHESGYALDPEAVRRAITPQTKLIVVTNLHNPSSVLTPESVLREIGEIARSVRRTRAGGRGLPGCGVREHAANLVSPGPASSW